MSGSWKSGLKKGGEIGRDLMNTTVSPATTGGFF
jgi:hypothetical protein